VPIARYAIHSLPLLRSSLLFASCSPQGTGYDVLIGFLDPPLRDVPRSAWDVRPSSWPIPRALNLAERGERGIPWKSRDSCSPAWNIPQPLDHTLFVPTGIPRGERLIPGPFWIPAAGERFVVYGFYPSPFPFERSEYPTPLTVTR
jgi:hypothetical protein